MSTRLSTTREQELECQIWNLKYTVGVPVDVLKDDGTKLRTNTRSEAYMLGGHTAVIMVDNIAGGYLLSRVKVPNV